MLGLEYQVAFTLPAPQGHLLGVALSRRRTDFSDEECSLLDAARPHLVQAYRNAREHTALLRRLGEARGIPPADLGARGLTPREAQVVRLMASGRTNTDIADELGCGARTVQTHLRNAYSKLGVHTRSEAARIAWAGYAASGASVQARTPAADIAGMRNGLAMVMGAVAAALFGLATIPPAPVDCAAAAGCAGAGAHIWAIALASLVGAALGPAVARFAPRTPELVARAAEWRRGRQASSAPARRALSRAAR